MILKDFDNLVRLLPYSSLVRIILGINHTKTKNIPNKGYFIEWVNPVKPNSIMINEMVQRIIEYSRNSNKRRDIRKKEASMQSQEECIKEKTERKLLPLVNYNESLEDALRSLQTYYEKILGVKLEITVDYKHTIKL